MAGRVVCQSRARCHLSCEKMRSRARIRCGLRNLFAVAPVRVAPWLERLRGLDIAQFSEIIDRVPEAYMPEQSRRFCLSLLGFTLQHLQTLK